VTVRVLTYILTPRIQHPSLSVVVTSLLAVCFHLHPFDGHISSLRRVGWVTWSVYEWGWVIACSLLPCRHLTINNSCHEYLFPGPRMKCETIRQGVAFKAGITSLSLYRRSNGYLSCHLVVPTFHGDGKWGFLFMTACAKHCS